MALLDASVPDMMAHIQQQAAPSPPTIGMLEMAFTDDPESLLWDALTRVESAVFVEKGYVKTHQELQEEYAPYIGRSTMIGLLNDGEVVGATRYIEYGPETGFKTLHDIQAGRLKLDERGAAIYGAMDLTKTCETGTIALKPEYRTRAGIRCVGLLYGALCVRAQNAGMDNMIASFDETYFKGFHRRFNSFTTPVGPAVDYMGSLTVPAHIDMNKVKLEMLL